MKKTLIALAAVAATGAAFAQSSVTLYGVADLGLADSNHPLQTTVMSGNGRMNNGSSRLGVRGTEDLGGGLKASFNFEQGINATNGKTDANTFQRAANLSLSGDFGSVKMGRTLTPSFYGVAAWELTGAANYSVVAGQFGFAGTGARNSSELSYTTPNMSGFSATIGTVLKADNAGNAKYDLNVVYKAGPLAAGFSYNTVANNGAEGYALGAKYDFGGFVVAGSYNDSDLAGGAQNAKGFSIGAGMTAGPVALVLDIARDTAAKDTDVLVEAKYPLSKRTFAYAAFLRDGKGKTLTNVNNYGVGIRHNF